jgi:hypothetical protein
MGLCHTLICLIIEDQDRPLGTTLTRKKASSLKLAMTSREAHQSMTAMAKNATVDSSSIMALSTLTMMPMRCPS